MRMNIAIFVALPLVFGARRISKKNRNPLAIDCSTINGECTFYQNKYCPDECAKFKKEPEQQENKPVKVNTRICKFINSKCNAILKSKCPDECAPFEKQDASSKPKRTHSRNARITWCNRIQTKCPPWLKDECPAECAKQESSDEVPQPVVPKAAPGISKICQNVLERKQRCVGFMMERCKDQCMQFEPASDAPKDGNKNKKKNKNHGKGHYTPKMLPICEQIKSRCAPFMANMCPAECAKVLIDMRKSSKSIIDGDTAVSVLAGVVKKPPRTVAEYCLIHPFAKFLREDNKDFGMTIACTGDIGSGVEACFFKQEAAGEICRSTYQKLDAQLDGEGKFSIPVVHAYDKENTKEWLLKGTLMDQSLQDGKITVIYDGGNEKTFKLTDAGVQIDTHAICERISSRCAPFLVPHCPDECAVFDEDKRIDELEKSFAFFSESFVGDGARESGPISETPETGTAVDICKLPQYTDMHREDDKSFLLYFGCDDETGSGFEVCIFRSHAPGLQICRRSIQHLASYLLDGADEFAIPLVRPSAVGEDTILKVKIGKTPAESIVTFEGGTGSHVYHY